MLPLKKQKAHDNMAATARATAPLLQPAHLSKLDLNMQQQHAAQPRQARQAGLHQEGTEEGSIKWGGRTVAEYQIDLCTHCGITGETFGYMVFTILHQLCTCMRLSSAAMCPCSRS